MRRSLLIIPGLLLATAASAGGWHWLHQGDSIAEARSLMQQGNLRGAQLVLRDLVSHHPERADAHLMLGQLQLRMSDPAAAEHELRQASDQGADEHAVRPLLAQALVGQRQAAAVLRDFKADGLNARQGADLHVARALAAASLKQPELAREEAAAARAAAPDSADVALNVTRVLESIGDWSAASQSVDAALAIAPHDLAALMLRGQILVQQGQIPAALAAYDAALADPSVKSADSIGAHIARASLRLQTGDEAGARSDTAAALKAAPRNPLANYLDATLDARAGQWQKADEAISATGPVFDRFPRGDILLAAVKMNVGQPQQALDAAERYHGHHPADPVGAKLLAQVDMALGRVPAAVSLLTQWTTSNPADPDTLAVLSQAYASSGHAGDANAALQKAASASKGDAGALSRMANLALREGNAGLASDMLQTALGQRSAAPALVQADAQTEPGKTPPPASPSRADTAAALVLTSLRAGQIDRAAAALETLRAEHGDPELVDMLTGGVHLAQSDLGGARAAFESAAAREPGAIPPLVSLARVMRLQGDTDAAIALLRAPLAKQPANPALFAAFVDLAVSRNELNDAVSAAEAAHAAAPSELGYIATLANLYNRTGQSAKALALAETLPAASAAQLSLRADAERSLGHEDAAITAWQGLIAKAPQDVALRRRIAAFMIIDHRDDAADQMLREGLAAVPNDPGLQADIVTLTARRDGLGAGLARADAFAAHSSSLSVLMLKGSLLKDHGQFADAAAAFAQVRDTLPKTAPPADAEMLLVRQADAMASGGDKAGSVKLLQDWQGDHPDSLLTLQALANLDLAAGALPQARAKLETVLKGQPNNAAALNNLAWIEQRQGQSDAAFTDGTRAYLLAPSPQTADTLGWSLVQSGRAADGLALLRQASAGQPPDPSIKYHLAVALQQAGHMDEAKAVLQPLVDGEAAFDEKGQAVALLKALSKS